MLQMKTANGVSKIVVFFNSVGVIIIISSITPVFARISPRQIVGAEHAQNDSLY